MNPKSKIAFDLTCKEYLNDATATYLWTFTLPCVAHLDQFRDLWRHLQIKLVRCFGWHGVRVFEVHPNGHGYHVHMICKERYPVREVRVVSTSCGWGRINVLDFGKGVAGYVSKHLQKKREGCLKSVRLWGPVNLPYYTRQKDIEQRGGVGAHMAGMTDETVEKFFPTFKSMNHRQKHGAKLWCSMRQHYLGAICQI